MGEAEGKGKRLLDIRKWQNPDIIDKTLHSFKASRADY